MKITITNDIDDAIYWSNGGENMDDSKITEFRDLHKKYQFDENGFVFSPLWHYTSADGLVGIIRDVPTEHGRLHFWFTRSDCLNDTSEGTHIMDLFLQICDDLLNRGDISHEFYDSIKSCTISAHQLINYPLPMSEDGTHNSMLDCAPCHAYICSFSLKEDSLDMWRYYSKGNGGYGLKLNPFMFDSYKDYEYSDYDENAIFIKICSYKVIYDDREKIEKLNQIILDTFSAYQNENISKAAKAENAKYFIQFALKNFQFQFKHQCYASEQEYRFVVYLPYSKPASLKNELPTVKYRLQNGMVVPYIDLVVENGIDYLSDLLISPYIENKNVLATTHDYLSHCGFSCKTRLSQLPVRK